MIPLPFSSSRSSAKVHSRATSVQISQQRSTEFGHSHSASVSAAPASNTNSNSNNTSNSNMNAIILEKLVKDTSTTMDAMSDMSSHLLSSAGGKLKDLVFGTGEDDYSNREIFDTKWAHGLRGMAAAFVVSSHMTITLNRRIASPCCDDDGNTMLLQRPIFRLIMQGQAWVAVFFVMLGFVNSLKALKLSRAGDPGSAVKNISQTAFRRICRLILPAWGATAVNWLLVNSYMFEKARFGDGFWLAITSAVPSASWGSSLEDLFSALVGTWHMDFRNPYDQPQWAMIFLLHASVMVMTALVVLVHFRPGPRMIALGLIMAWSTDWSWNNRDPMIGLNIFGGMAMCEISLSAPVMRRLFRLSPILTPPLLLIGLCLMSFPTDWAENAPWSLYLLELGQSLASNVNEWGRWWNSFGALFFLFSVLISPILRRALTHPLLQWLGNNSFSIYMIHGAVMRSFFTWILYLGEEPIYHEPSIEEYEADPFAVGVWSYPLPSHGWTIISVLMFIPVLAACAHLWTKKVEPRFDRVAGWLEALVFMEGVKASSPSAGSPGSNGNGSGSRSPIPVTRTMEREIEKAKERERAWSGSEKTGQTSFGAGIEWKS